jgi:DNA-binding FadR family transcriptional regulator
VTTRQALNELRSLLREGGFAPRGKLPPERELARRLGVGRGTLRKSLAVLEAEGRITRHVGQGTFVDGPPDASAASGFPGGEASPAEVLEARAVIDPAIAGLAAMRATPEQIARMRHCIEKSVSEEGWPNWDRWMGTLFRTIAEAAGNGLLQTFMAHVDGRRSNDEWAELRARALTPDWQRTLSAQHRGIVDAIAARDAARAAELTREHHLAVRARYFGIAGEIGIPVA